MTIKFNELHSALDAIKANGLFGKCTMVWTGGMWNIKVFTRSVELL